jgi:biotin carboxylase
MAGAGAGDPVRLLALTSYEKGNAFLRAAAEAGASVTLLTVEQLVEADWPRDVLSAVHVMPSLENAEHVVNAVSWLNRQQRIDRIVALDEFDLEMAALLREHMRVPGPGVTRTRAVRDKLAMRELAGAAGVAVPEFTGVFHHGDVDAFLRGTRGPWLLKPRAQASAIGIRRIEEPHEIWPVLEQLGDMQSHHVLERFVTGDVYHLDGVVCGGEVLLAEVHRYAQPPFEVMHGGGLFCSATVPRGGAVESALHAELPRVLRALELEDGAFHVEFIHAAEDGRFHFLEAAARVGGAHIAEMVEAATGVNLWAEWARLELARARGTAYVLPEPRRDHGGVLISLARQEWPDLGGYTDPEVAWRVHKRHHAGLVVVAPDADRVRNLLNGYMGRFRDDFFATLPAPDRATH